MKNTHEKILEEALNLFSKYGYAGTSVQDLGAAVGIKAPSLYKHFESKRAIYDEVVRRGENAYKEALEEIKENGPEKIRAEKESTGKIVDYLVNMEKSRFKRYLSNAPLAKNRRFNRLEVYHDRKNAKSFVNKYYLSAVEFYKEVFAVAFDMEGQDEEVEWMAQKYVGLVSTGLSLCDALPGKQSYVLGLIEKQLREFAEERGAE